MDNIKLKSETKKITITDFSKSKLKGKQVSSEVYCTGIYNFNAQKGVLKNMMGIRNITSYAKNDITSNQYYIDYNSLELERIDKIMHFKQYFQTSGDTVHRLLIYGSDKKLYMFQMYSNLLTPNWTYSLEFDNIPVVLEYKKDGRDSILISANDKLIVWTTGRTPYELTEVPTITSMCEYNKVLYCTIAGESDKMWYTSTLDPEKVGVESDATGYITLDYGGGGGVKTVILNENVYIFRDFGISRLNTYANAKPTSNQVYLSESQIYPNTIAVCGDYVIFLTKDGLYKFNGSTVKKIDALHDLFENSNNIYSVGVHFQDSYYLATNIDFEDNCSIGCEKDNNDMKNNALIKLNIYDNSFEILRGVDIKDMLPLKTNLEEKIVITFNSVYHNHIGELVDTGNCFGAVFDKAYYSNEIVEHNMKQFAIRKLVVDCSQNVTVRIICDGKEYLFNSYCEGVNEFYTLILCKKFKIAVTSNNQFPYVNYVEVEYVKQK